MSKPCPTEAAACCVARSFGRALKPSGARPAAIAPDETKRTSAPRARSEATKSTIFDTDSESNFDPAVPVSEDEPILITTRFAVVTALRLIYLSSFGVGSVRRGVFGSSTLYSHCCAISSSDS